MDTAESIIAWLIINLADIATLIVELIIIGAICKSCKYLAYIANELHNLYILLYRQDYEYRHQASDDDQS